MFRGCFVNDGDPTPRRWRDHLPAVLILGSPAAAAGMTLSVILTDIFLLPGEAPIITVGVTLAVPINALLGVAGAAAGALRVGGTVSTRVAVLVASVGFAAAVYGGTIELAAALIPGFAEGFERYGP